MKRIHTHRLISLALLCFSSTALAQAPLLPCSTWAKWTGFYAGAQGGYAGGNATWKFPAANYYLLSSHVGRSFTADPQWTALAAHLGLSYQIQAFVIGLESTYTGRTLSQTQTGVLEPVNFPNDSFTTSISDIRTLTARLGYAHDDWQLFVRGGGAAAHVALKASSGAPGAGVMARQSNTQGGWTLGAGLEYMASRAIVLGLQYDFIQLNDQTFKTKTTGTVIGTPFQVNLQDVSVNTVTASLNLKVDEFFRQ